jgi:hypothetical protein
MIGAELAHRGDRHRDETGRNATRRDAGWGTGGAPAYGYSVGRVGCDGEVAQHLNLSLRATVDGGSERGGMYHEVLDDSRGTGRWSLGSSRMRAQTRYRNRSAHGP